MPIDLSQIKSHRNTQDAPRGNETQSILKKEIAWGSPFNDRRKESFYSELVILLSSGLDLKGALDIIIEEQRNPRVAKILQDIMKQIIHGASFSGAIQGKSDFGAYEYYSIRIGEESGRLMEVLQELANFFRKRIKQRKQLVSAFSYPAVIFLTAFGAVFFMMNFIVPLFADAFKRFNSELPALTLAVIRFSGFFRHWWWLLLLVMGSLVVFIGMFHKRPWYRQFMSGLLLKMPLLGSLIQKIYLARFCQSMALMAGAKTPLIQSLDLVGKMMGLYAFEQALKQIQNDIFHGKLLHQAMQKHKIFDPKMVSLIKVGEETNRLDTIFKRLHEQYSEETDHQTALLSTLLEPLLIILVGGMVALILIAMYLPMFRLGSSLMGT